MKRKIGFWVLGFGFWLLTLHASRLTAYAATGCNYPTSLDAFSDKQTGDFLLVVDVNVIRSCLEKLEAGPLRPNKGTVSTPAYSFQGDTDTGVDSLAADSVSLIALGVERVRASANGLELIEQTAPGTPAANKVFFYSRDVSGKSEMFYKNDAGDERPLNLVVGGAFGSVGQDSKNNAATPNTQFDLAATAVLLRDSNNSTVIRYNPSTVTNDVTVSGPAANGRDASAAFTLSSFIHFYWIWNGTTLASLSSVVAPPTGPTLPSGYTHSSYAGTVRFNASSQLVKTRIKKSLVSYEVATNALSAGASTTEATVVLSALIPPNASAATLLFFLDGTAALTSSKIRYVSGSDYATLQVNNADVPAYLKVPNVGQQIFYINSSSSLATTIDVLGYEVPNGGV